MWRFTGNAMFQNNPGGNGQWVRGVQFNGSVTGVGETLTANLGNGAASSSGTGTAGLVFDPSSAATASVVIAGSAGPTLNGSGSLSLSGLNTYTGATTITAGTLQAGVSTNAGNTAGPLGVGSALSLGSSGTLDLKGFNVTIGSLATAVGTITDTSSPGILTITGSLGGGNATLITGSAGVYIGNGNGSNLLTNASNTYSGGTYLGIGSTNLARFTPATNQIVGVTTPGALTNGIFGTGTIFIGKATTDQGQIYFANSGVTINNAITYNSVLGTDVVGATRFDSGSNTLAGIQTAFLSAISYGSYGTGAATVTGQLTGSGTFTGTISNSTGNLGGGTVIGTNAGLIVGASAQAVATITLNNTAANNNYTGDTYITAKGVLVTGAANQLPSGANTGNVYLNGTFNLGGFSQSIGELSGSGTLDGVSGTPTLTLGGNNATGLTFSGTIKNTAGSLALTLTGTGTQTLSGANTFSGVTTVNSGATLTLSNSLALQNSTLNTSGGGIVTLSGVTTPTIGGLTGSTSLASVITTGYSGVTTLTLNPVTGVSDSYSGVIANGAAGMNLTMSGAGTQTLSGEVPTRSAARPPSPTARWSSPTPAGRWPSQAT